VKYNRYREAVELALEDKIKSGALRIEAENGNPNHVIMNVTIFVVGAGRGPLVNASLDAVENVNHSNAKIVGSATKISIHPTLVAIEKNQCASLYLQSLKTHDARWRYVTVIECDMRLAYNNPFLSSIINGPETNKVDIVVSELLGSFGCNELSPECLDGFQLSGLMKETCISIPQSYTSYIAPVTSMKLHSEVQAHAFFPSNPLRGPGGEATGVMQAMETPYVVRSHLASQTHEEQPCWDFSHPTKKTNISIKDAVLGINNERSAEILFSGGRRGFAYGSGYGKKNTTLTSLNGSIKDESSDGTTIHGLLGTFSCVLYKSTSGNQATISIQPSSFSVGMFSWFPLFFPLRDPMFVPSGGSVQCGIWRKVEASNGGGRVWYEWCVSIISKSNEILSISPIHNPNGRSCVVRL
jgi:protein arginine N-methyltransferase 5